MKKVQSFLKGLPPTGQSQQTTPKRIMLVEDNHDINNLFLTVLQYADKRLNVDAFTDPYVALENFKPRFYDLLLIDIVMPKILS
jgi:CheY-like chemotaxis protein